jgi:hypothetical protein
MPDLKISQLAAGTPVALSDALPIARAGTNKQLSADALMAASQRRNLVINGDFKRASRGAGFVLTTGFAYTIDLWAARQTTAAACNVNQILSYATGLGTPGAMLLTLTGTSTGQIQVAQLWETLDCVPYQNRNVTVSFMMYRGTTWSPPNMAATLYTGTNIDGGVGGLGGAGWTANSQAFNPAAASVWTPFSFTVAIGAGVYQLGLMFSATPTGAAIDANSFCYIANVAITEGAVAPLAFPPRHVAEEHRLCNRYIRKGQLYVPAAYASLPIDMRAVPTISGGGAGYDSTGTTADYLTHKQTAGALQTLTLSAEL